MNRHQQIEFHGLFLANFLISLGFGICNVFFPLYCRNMGARSLLIGVAVGGYALAKIVFSPTMGQLADRIGARTLVLSSLTLYLLVSCAYLTTENLLTAVGLRMMQGVACAMFRPVVQAQIAESAAVEKRGSTMGSFDASFYAALGIGPVIGGFIMDKSGFQGLFYVLVACSSAALVIAFVTLPRKFNSTVVASCQSEKTSLRLMLRQASSMQGLLFFIFGRACGITAWATFLPILLSTDLHLSGGEIGIIMSSTSLMMTVLLRPVGKIADKMSRRLLVICGGAMSSFLYILMPVASDFNQALVISLGLGVFSALSQPALSSLLAEHGQRLGMGTSVGIFHAFLNLGFVVGPLLGSLLNLSSGLHGIFIFIGLVGLGSVCGFTLSSSTPHQAQEFPSVNR